MAIGTPYLQPSTLVQAPSGISWSMVPDSDSTDAEQQAALVALCWRATSRIDTYCHQVLRATADTEYLNGPGMPRCNVDRNTGAGVLNMRRWPVTEVLAIQVSPSRSFPRVWSPVPAGMWDIRHPLLFSGDSASATAPDGGWTVDVAPGCIGFSQYGRTSAGGFTGGGGRGSQRVQVCYVNGWPHTSLTEAAAIGDTVLNVDDVTGWALASGFAYDGSATEPLSAESVAAASPFALPNDAGTAEAGAGTITLTAPLEFAHQQGTLISALPATVIEAAVYAACAQALDSGIEAVAVQSLSGERVSSEQASQDIVAEYKKLLDPFRRVM
jgi:hypothetical protein